MKEAGTGVESIKEVQELLAAGKEKGYLTYDDVNNALPDSINDADSVDEVLALLARHGVRLVDWVQ
jgi:RNA polymerase primary sigma factor